MSKSAVPVAAPKTLRYEQDAGLPVAIEARSNRRSFWPANGDKFSPSATNVIRMTINSNSFIDFSHSYLQFTVTNADADRTLTPDLGVPFFSRLQIMSGGQELEDIQEWSRLYATLLSAQGSRLNSDELSLTQHDPNVFSQVGANEVTDITVAELTGLDVGNVAAAGTVALAAKINASLEEASGDGANRLNPSLNPDATALTANRGAGSSATYSVPIMSGIFNIEKYFPLLLTDQGLDLYFTLAPHVEVGCWSGIPAVGYEISNVKYVAHEVNLDDGFVNQMKSSMSATGGMLSLSSTTYRYYQQQHVGNTTSEDHNISCRVKSLKGLIVRPQHQDMATSSSNFGVSTGQNMGITEVQFRIGSVLYPQEPIKFSNSNKGELFQEIRKCFGTIGSYNHGTMLNDSTLQTVDDERPATVGIASSQRSLFMMAYDFETFAKSATESGINVSDRALPVTMSLTKRTAANVNVATRYDTWAMCDCIIYIDLMGRMTTRI